MRVFLFKKDYKLKKVKILHVVEVQDITELGLLTEENFSSALRVGKNWGWESSDTCKEIFGALSQKK